MVKDIVRETAPQIISDYLRENLTVDFNLKENLIQSIMRQL